MKKIVSILLAILMLGLSTAALAEAEKIAIGATPVPHAEILEHIKPLMAEKGFDLEVVVFTDYVLPNNNVESDDLFANFFQHTNYLYDFNAKNGTHLVPMIPVHFEPMGVFKGKTDSIEALADGATIGVPNDTTNEARALLLLETMGLIELDPNAGIEATKLSITKNEKNLEIVEVQAELLPHMLNDFDLAVINGNYAMDAGLTLADDSVGAEGADNVAAASAAGIVNYIVVKEGNEDAPFVSALREALNDQSTIDFIAEKYQGSVVMALDAETPEAPAE